MRLKSLFYAADLNTWARTNRILHYIEKNVVYAAAAVTGHRMDRKLKFIEGPEKTD